MASQDWFEKDFYATLGVPPDADEAAIKKAYRKLAKQYHPDRNEGDAAAEQRFKDVGEAHSVLSDPTQREEYDAIRQMARGGARFTAGGPGGPGGGSGGFEDVFSSMFSGGGGSPGGGRARYSTGGPGFGSSGGGEPDLEDILSMFGQGGQGGGSPFGGAGFSAPRPPQKGPDHTARATLDFRDAIEGSTITLEVGGEQVTTKIPAGVKDGQKIRLRGKGGSAPGSPRGDLILTVTVTPHPVFRREGSDLVLDLPVSIAEAALGATVAVPTLDGGQVKVRIAPGTPSGRTLRVRGRGVPSKGGTGDLRAKVQVVVPSDLDDAQRAAIEALRDLDTSDPRAELVAKVQA